MDLLLRLERIEGHPLPGEARREVADGLREVQSIQRKVSLRELPLPQPRPKGIDRIVAARDVFGEAELRQKLGTRDTGRRFRVQVISPRDCRYWALGEGQINGLTQCQRLLRLRANPQAQNRRENPIDR